MTRAGKHNEHFICSRDLLFAGFGANACFLHSIRLVEVLVKIKNPKFISGNDIVGKWRDEGHDACRTNFTTSSTKMEWCIAEPSQIKVHRVKITT